MISPPYIPRAQLLLNDFSYVKLIIVFLVLEANKFITCFVAPCRDVFKCTVIIGKDLENLPLIELLYHLIQLEKMHRTHHVNDIRGDIRIYAFNEFHSDDNNV